MKEWYCVVCSIITLKLFDWELLITSYLPHLFLHNIIELLVSYNFSFVDTSVKKKYLSRHEMHDVS